MFRFALLVSLATLIFSSTATAQQAGTGTDNTSIIMTAPASDPAREVWFQQDLDEANERVLKIRNSLIGTSVGFTVGAILAGIGASQCQVIERTNQNDEYLCNNAGDVLVPLGGTIAALGAIGMITTGIMLGVAKKRRRDMERDFRRRVYGRQLEWHPSGVLRF